MPRALLTHATAALATLCPLLAAATPSTPTVHFGGCNEFVGVAPVDAQRARALVPQRYTPVADAAGARLVVRVADCTSVRVGALPARPGRVAQIGLIIVSPDGTATDPNTGINNYTLSYASNSPALVAALRGSGVPATLDTGLALEITPADGPGTLYAAVSPELDSGPVWFLYGSVTTPTVQTRFLANWWRLAGGQSTKMATDIPSIAFDFSSAVSFTTSRANVVGQLLQAHHVASFPLSFRGRFDSGVMQVTRVP